MSRISTKINLAGLKHSRKMMNGQSGPIECVIIPIEANKLFVGEKGIYLDLIGFEIANPKGKETHVVKQSLPLEILEKMTEEERNDMPLLGSHVVWQSSAIGEASPAPITSEEDDLPF